MTKSLDLGCGPNPKNPYNADEIYGVDVRADLDKRIHQADLCIEPIPFESNMFDCVTAFDFIEHIPRIIYAPHRRNAFIELMTEIYRVLKVGGVFLSYTPAFPHPSAFQDPTHVNIITDRTFDVYFCKPIRYASVYGFTGAFEMAKQSWQGEHLLTQIIKVPV